VTERCEIEQCKIKTIEGREKMRSTSFTRYLRYVVNERLYGDGKVIGRSKWPMRGRTDCLIRQALATGVLLNINRHTPYTMVLDA